MDLNARQEALRRIEAGEPIDEVAKSDCRLSHETVNYFDDFPTGCFIREK
jgi:hypothetical protein